MKIITNEAISAIYYALWQGGYAYAHPERDGAHMAALSRFKGDSPPPFFSHVRQSTCEVYPYWPRAALLETTSFYVKDGAFTDLAGLRRKILSAPNVADNEWNGAFFAWLADFPSALLTDLAMQEALPAELADFVARLPENN